MSLNKVYEIRDPIHGMLSFNSLEWDLINSKPYQRLRRIRQLAWTDYVYPGAMHTRFEHCLGVCHVASRLFNSISDRDADILNSDYGINSAGRARQLQIIRLAALTHDLGHGPLSHAAEEAFPKHPVEDRRWRHEEYSAAITRKYLTDLIEQHPINRNYHIKINEITAFYEDASEPSDSLVWKEIISGQMDADRMDYLLRDSYHSGVSYGRYDLDRVVNSVCLCRDPESIGHVVGSNEGGLHAVEGLLIARYMMFTQVYFHKVRVSLDYHYERALKSILGAGGSFPPPTESGLENYMDWDDWRILHEVVAQQHCYDCKALRERDHHRLVYSTPECPDDNDLQRFDDVKSRLCSLNPVQREAKKSWYKFDNSEIRLGIKGGQFVPLATRSPVVDGLRSVNQKRLYVKPSLRHEASRLLGDES